MDAWKCFLCHKLISSHSNLKKHLKNIHGYSKLVHSYNHKIWNNKCLEEGCSKSFAQNEMLIQHLKDFHSIDIEREHLEFSNMVEFLSWKLSVEEDNKCYYKLKARRGPISYYDCHRSGKIRALAKHAQKVPKLQGSCKLDRACTSVIKVIVGKTISAMWIKTHYGHTQDLRHLRISKVDRALIASKLSEGISSSKILDSIQNQTKVEETRSQLITRKDIYNIGRSFSVTKSLAAKHSDENCHNEAPEHSHDYDNLDDSRDTNEFVLMEKEIGDEEFICATNNFHNIEILVDNSGEAMSVESLKNQLNGQEEDTIFIQLESDSDETPSLDLHIENSERHSADLRERLSRNIRDSISRLLSFDFDDLDVDIKNQIIFHLNAIEDLISSHKSSNEEAKNEENTRQIVGNKYNYINSNIVKRPFRFPCISQSACE